MRDADARRMMREIAMRYETMASMVEIAVPAAGQAAAGVSQADNINQHFAYTYCGRMSKIKRGLATNRPRAL
jgi:hypothetical protein